MSRNLVICFDGTNNQFGPQNTNVIRLVEALDRTTNRQLVYYDPGVGTLPEPGVWTSLGKKASEVMGLALGAGLTGKVERAYSFLMDYWEPDDRLFLFGFSRGAYTARVFAGMLHALGLLPAGNHNLVPYALRLYKAMRQGIVKSQRQTINYWRLAHAFRRTFTRQVPKAGSRRLPVHFLGVWDTVASVGWVWDPVQFPYTASNPSVATVRHAVALDERRWFFRQNLLGTTDKQDFKQYWFAGDHSDIGGGYSEEDGGLWRVAFEWMLQEAQTAGLVIDPAALKHVRGRSNTPVEPWNERQHESLSGMWWLAEIFPKRMWDYRTSGRSFRVGLGRNRFVPDGAMLHESALKRIQSGDYGPPNLSLRFISEVRSLDKLPEALRYKR